MAVFRIHRREWEAWAAAQARKRARSESKSSKRRHGSQAGDGSRAGEGGNDADDDVGGADDEDEDGEGAGDDETPWRTPSKPKSTSSSRKTKPHPKQGISSGLSTVVRHAGGAREVRRGAGASTGRLSLLDCWGIRGVATEAVVSRPCRLQLALQLA